MFYLFIKKHMHFGIKRIASKRSIAFKELFIPRSFVSSGEFGATCSYLPRQAHTKF